MYVEADKDGKTTIYDLTPAQFATIRKVLLKSIDDNSLLVFDRLVLEKLARQLSPGSVLDRSQNGENLH